MLLLRIIAFQEIPENFQNIEYRTKLELRMFAKLKLKHKVKLDLTKWQYNMEQLNILYCPSQSWIKYRNKWNVFAFLSPIIQGGGATNEQAVSEPSTSLFWNHDLTWEEMARICCWIKLSRPDTQIIHLQKMPTKLILVFDQISF